MALNTLKIATDGYLKRQTKAVLIIAVAGYLNFSAVVPTENRGGGGYQPTVAAVDKKREDLRRNEQEWMLFIKIFTEQCQ